MDLLSINNRVAAPFITVTIGEYSFGLYSRKKTTLESFGRYYSAIKVTYPNYMKSLEINKVNGTLNNYTLVMSYPITQNDDPNMIDKILGTVSSTRKIVFTYGDCATPSFMYRNEEAIITKVQSNLDIASSKITYTISAVSSALAMASNSYTFQKVTAKPSDIIKELLYNKTYGMQEIFYGMHNKEQVESLGLILGDDREVVIEAKYNITILNYLDYLVSCMSSQNDSPNTIEKTARYILSIHDDTSGILDGPYFKITKLSTEATTDTSIDYYTVDIGYPNKDLVLDFSVDDDESYALLYNYSRRVPSSDFVYRIDDDGQVVKQFSPSISNSRELLKTTEADRTWWSQVTQFPIKATLKLRGLLRAAVLMSYIRVNVYFYGKKYNGGTGLYLITKQVDSISESGYSTTLSLVRVGESENA